MYSSAIYRCTYIRKAMSNRKKLKDVYRDTIYKCTTGKFKKLTYGESTKFTNLDLKNVVMKPMFDQTIVEVVNEDTFVTCEQLLKNDRNICALNMASYLRPGGGVGGGSMAQEEELFRRSNYFLTLKDHFYPFKRSEVVYSSHIHVVKDKLYADMGTPFRVSMIAASAIKYPDLSPDKKSYSSQEDYDTMRSTINNIFKVAYLNKHTTLVLGAIGCGAYANPTQQVIKIFNEFLHKYSGCFKTVVFAVYSKDPITCKRKNGNFDEFDSGIIKMFN
jgi:uncharacterized protein (TIGR02452 family)